MSLGKVARKLKRVGKTAFQFRFTSTFEYIELSCNGTWRPENLRIIWLRNHRRVQSIDVKWTPTEDRGPNGAVGKGTFDPAFSVALIVTVYGDPSSEEVKFEEKEYKYYIESDGPSGKKIVASFNIDIAEYASMKSSKHTLDMSFKPVSKKIDKAVLGITLQSEFMKQGLPVAAGDVELVTLGTGERMKRTTLPQDAPRKPERRTPAPSPSTTPALQRKSSQEMEDETMAREEDSKDTETSVENKEDVEGGTGLAYMNLNAEGEIDSAEGEIDDPPWEGHGEGEGRGDRPTREEARDKRTSRRARRQREKLERDRERQEERERRQEKKKEERERKLKEKSKSPPPTQEPSVGPPLPPREKSDSLTDTSKHEEEEEGEGESEDAASAAEVVMISKPNKINACGETVFVCFDATTAEEGTLTAVCKGTKTGAVDTSVREEEEGGKYRVQFVPQEADVFMLSVSWCGFDVPGSPFLINLNLLPPAHTPQEKEGERKNEATKEEETRKVEKEVVQSDGGSHFEVKSDLANTSKKVEDGGSTAGERGSENGKREGERSKEATKKGDSQEVREKSPAIVVSEDPFEMAYEASRLLEAQKKAVMKSHSQQTTPQATPQKSGRRVVASKEDWTPPPNHLYEDIPEGEESTEAPPIVSPLDAWLGEAQFIDCFGESVSREKLEGAEIIGLYFSANWCPPCRRFLPKLVKFYHNLKQNQKSFEMLYISSDYSRQEMTKYMQEQQMPWLALAFDSTISDKLRVDYNVAAIPILTIVSKTGAKLEERARKAVEQASSISSVLKLYGKWVERTQQLGQPTAAATGQAADHQPVEGEEKKGGILKTLKSAIHKPGSEVPLGRSPGAVETQKSVGDTSDSESGGVRVTVEQRSRSRTKQKSKEGGGPTAEEMEEKEERLRHLEEVNMSLKQTNDDLNEEVAELKKQIGEFQAKLTMLEKSSKKLEDEKRELMANLNIRGWLLKKGLKGPTANRWRRRYFRCDQGSKIYYYKSASEGTPQGFIDLDLVVSVQEISPAQQDKNHATFLVQCEGRTFQLQAHDETTMRKWMSAIEYLKNWRQRNAHSISGH